MVTHPATRGGPSQKQLSPASKCTPFARLIPVPPETAVSVIIPFEVHKYG